MGKGRDISFLVRITFKTITFIIITLLSLSCIKDEKPYFDLTLVPPSFITNQVLLDIRAGIKNNSTSTKQIELEFFIDDEKNKNLIHKERVSVLPDSAQTVKFLLPTHNLSGHRKIILLAKEGGKKMRIERNIEIVSSQERTPDRINGAWTGIYHWSETEGKLWNKEIKKMTDSQWRELIKAMHEIHMDIVVIQEVFRNQEYVHKHNIQEEGYQGKAFYPSDLYPSRMPIAAQDPVEAILEEADKQNMHVFMGVGLYAWFDFSKGSLNWHKKVADELWKKYGHHPSFYGWYISEEIEGGLGDSIQRKDIVPFFKAFTAHVNQFAPGKPVMLATNCHNTKGADKIYNQLLPHLDILCPFGFHRMPAGDYSGEEVAKHLQELCDKNGSHLWMDMETFLFNREGALYPRPIDGLIDDLKRFKNFEQILCYQFPGLMNSPDMTRKPGGDATVKLYLEYKKFVDEPK